MGVSLRPDEVGMPHKLLDRVGVYSCLDQASSECVAQVVEPEIPHPAFSSAASKADRSVWILTLEAFSCRLSKCGQVNQFRDVIEIFQIKNNVDGTPDLLR
jgi:hypothetical protein